MPGTLAQLAKVLLDIEAKGDRAGAESWFAKYDTMPAELTRALAATSGIPVRYRPAVLVQRRRPVGARPKR